MPKKDLWVGTTDPDPAAVVGSADSCDSMISNNSSQSEMVNLLLFYRVKVDCSINYQDKLPQSKGITFLAIFLNVIV